MPCSLPDDLAWSPLLAARDLLTGGASSFAFVQRDGQWRCEPPDTADFTGSDGALLVGDDARMHERAHAADCPVTFYTADPAGLPELRNANGRGIDHEFATAARVYLPILLGSAAARRAGRSFVAGHVTQTLDGRIACENGQSQWIGNAADLAHAHRMRALCDGVLVGATTALRDDPQLNVRHVDGPDPRRIVLSGRGRLLASDRPLKLLQSPGCDVLVGERHVGDARADDTVRVLSIGERDGRVDLPSALAALRERGVHSIYLEGGSGTLSSFLQAGCVDVLQVHIAAMVLGSGLPSLQLPAVDHVDHGMRLAMDHAVLDGHVLLTCVPSPA